MTTTQFNLNTHTWVAILTQRKRRFQWTPSATISLQQVGRVMVEKQDGVERSGEKNLIKDALSRKQKSGGGTFPEDCVKPSSWRLQMRHQLLCTSVRHSLVPQTLETCKTSKNGGFCHFPITASDNRISDFQRSEKNNKLKKHKSLKWSPPGWVLKENRGPLRRTPLQPYNHNHHVPSLCSQQTAALPCLSATPSAMDPLEIFW